MGGAAGQGRDPAADPRLVLKLLHRTAPHRTAQDEMARFLSKLKATTGDVARVYGIKVSARMWREYLEYDPRPGLAAIPVPVPAITGDNDLSIDPGDLDVIAQLVPGPVETRRARDLTHILRRDPGPASMRNYRKQYRRPVDPGLLEDVAKRVSTHLHGRGESAQD